MKIQNAQIVSNDDTASDPYPGMGRALAGPYASSQDRTDMYSDDADGCDLPETDDYRLW